MKSWRPGRPRFVLFLFPAAVYLLLLAVYPFLNLLLMSVSQVSAANIVRGSWPLVGLSNFTELFSQSDFQQAIPITLAYVLIVTAVGMAGGLLAANLLQEQGPAAALALGLMVFTWAMPPVVLGSLWKFLLLPNGLVNAAASGLGLTGEPLFWLVRKQLALYSVALVNAWAIVPFAALVYRAALMDIPKDILDASQVDGATGAQQFYLVKLPLLLPISLILTILTVVYAFRSFDFIYVMTYGGPGVSTTTLPFLSYRLSFVNFSFDLGSAVAVLTILVVAVLAYFYVGATREAERR